MYVTKTRHVGNGFHISYSYATKTIMAAVHSTVKYVRVQLAAQDTQEHATYLMTWHKASNKLQLFKNGNLEVENESNYDSTEYESVLKINYISVGSSGNQYYPFLKFKLDNLKVWKQHLTTNDIQSLWAAGNYESNTSASVRDSDIYRKK